MIGKKRAFLSPGQVWSFRNKEEFWVDAEFPETLSEALSAVSCAFEIKTIRSGKSPFDRIIGVECVKDNYHQFRQFMWLSLSEFLFFANSTTNMMELIWIK